MAVFWVRGDAWVRLGDPIATEQHNDGWGAAVSLSADGATVAAGAPRNEVSDASPANTGHVRVFGLTW